jgi:hypothetical protein
MIEKYGDAVVNKKEDLEWRKLPVNKRIEHALVKGVTDFIVQPERHDREIRHGLLHVPDYCRETRMKHWIRRLKSSHVGRYV